MEEIKRKIDDAQDLIYECLDVNNIEKSAGLSALLGISIALMHDNGWTFQECKDVICEGIDEFSAQLDKREKK